MRNNINRKIILETRAMNESFNMDVTKRLFGDKIMDRLVNDYSRGLPSKWFPISKEKEPEHWDSTLTQVIAKLAEADPTVNKDYTTFIIKNYCAGGWGATIEDVHAKVSPALKKFDALKKKRLIESPYNDILRFKGFEEFINKMEEYELPTEDLVNRGKYEKIFENKEVTIVIPRDVVAARFFGQGTQWCTASKDSSNYFDQYSKEGNLYILLPKHPETKEDSKYPEKYQLHFESRQFMDELDHSVNLFNIVKIRFGDLTPVFSKYTPALLDYVEFNTPAQLQESLDSIKNLIVAHSYSFTNKNVDLLEAIEFITSVSAAEVLDALGINDETSGNSQLHKMRYVDAIYEKIITPRIERSSFTREMRNEDGDNIVLKILDNLIMFRNKEGRFSAMVI